MLGARTRLLALVGLVAFDESGEVRTLYPAGQDEFAAGPESPSRSPVQPDYVTTVRDWVVRHVMR